MNGWIQLGGKRLPSQLKRQLKPWERAYIACAIDTEGSIVLDPRTTNGITTHYASCITIANTEKAFLKRIKEILGFGNIHTYKFNKSRQKHFKNIHTLLISRKNTLIDLLEQIIPYLIIKREQAKHLLSILQAI